MARILILTVAMVWAAGLGAMATAPVLAGNPAAPIGGQDPNSLDSSEFRFQLGDTVTPPALRESLYRQRGINYVFERAVAILAGTVGGAAVLMTTVGGLMMLAGGANSTLYDNGKKVVVKSVIGLAITLGAYLLVSGVQLLVTSIFAK